MILGVVAVCFTASATSPDVCVQEKMCEGAVLMLLGNKLDLAEGHSRKVSTQEGQRLAEVRYSFLQGFVHNGGKKL